MLSVRHLCLFSLFFMGIRASTHWMVTENGLIQPRIDSPFEMARPYDLLAFLNQDTRWDNIILLYHDLKHRNDFIQNLWNELERDTDTNTQLSGDKNCLKAGPLNSLDWYISHLEDGRTRDIDAEHFLIQEPKPGDDVDVPDCKKISSLTFSMHTFEHLKAMVHRQNLSADPELALPEQISPIMTADQFGHWVAGVLRKNSSSWLHYNMASLYWRVQGNAPKAMECSRRSVHYSPREYKDIALLGMGTILHRSKMPEDAITVLGAAVDHAPKFPMNHFVLANAYAVMGDYNNSIRHYDYCMKINNRIEIAKKHKYGVLCHKTLLEKMMVVQVSITQLRENLFDYGQREAQWLKSQASFLRTMYHEEHFDYTHVEKMCNKMTELTGLNIRELKKEGDKNSLIQYFLDGPLYNENWLDVRGVQVLESAYNLQKLVQHIEKHASMITDYVANELLRAADGKIRSDIVSQDLLDMSKDKMPNEGRQSTHRQFDKGKGNQFDDDMLEYETGVPLYPTSIIVGRNTEEFDLDPNWPSSKFCKEGASKFPKDIDKIYPVFLPFENKGIRLRTLLADKIGVPAHTEHDLPWHPPTCSNDKDSSTFSIKKSQKPQISAEVATTEHLRRKLLEYVGNGNIELVKHMQDAEIGQRIYAAIQMKIAPKWILYTLASLYWRVRGNNAHAMNCLLLSSKTVPVRHRDLVLTSMASVYLEIGHFDDALNAAEESFHLSLYEPATNFVLAQMNMVKKHRNTQLYHLKQVVRVEPTFMEGFVRILFNAWSCAIKAEDEDIGYTEGDVCTQVDPGMSMVCEKDGTNCRVTNIHCFNNNNNRMDGSTLLTMIKMKDEEVDDSDEGILERLMEDIMQGNNDRLGHQKNYERMRRSLDVLLKDCGPDGCLNVRPIIDIALKEADCTYQQLQLTYWLHIISFRQLVNDAQLRLPIEVTAFQPSSNKIPDCKVSIDPKDEFFLERLSRIDVEGWEPVLSLMQQVAEMFNYFDYVTLGAKIARYVESRPREWVALLSAGWWCGAGGHAACCVRCLMASYAAAPPDHVRSVFLSIAALTHMQSKLQDAKDIAYLMFYMSPKNKLEAFLVAVSHTYVGEYEQAIWMYRYALSFDDKFVPAKACLHATMCLMLFGDNSKGKSNQ